MKPILVIGWEVREKENGKKAMWIYGTREINTDAAGYREGDGSEAVKIYVNPEYCDYKPQIGHKIIPIEGRYGVDQIYVVD